MALKERATGKEIHISNVSLDDRLNLVLLSTVLLRVIDRQLENASIPF